jgi:putative tricarboxylic transport membrane protein
MRSRAGASWFTGGDWMGSRRHVLAAAVIVAGVVAYAVLADVLGFLIVAPVLLLVWFRMLGVRWGTAVIAAILTTLAIWYVFYKLLRVPLPWGVLTPYAF